MAKKKEYRCKLCEQVVEDFKKHLAEEHDLTTREYKNLVQCKVCEQWLKQVNAAHLRTHSMTSDEYERYDPTPVFPPPPVVEFRRLVVESQPPPPEPKLTLRLVDCPSNPHSCGVEARPLCVYHFTKSQWREIPAPDAWILLGTETISPKYPHLKFEKKKTRR